MPERVAHEGQDIGEGGVLLGVPGRAPGGDGLPPLPDMGGQRQPAAEAQQGRGGAQDGLVRPLPLRLHAQIGAHGLKGHFHGPAPQVQGQDLGRGQGRVGAQQSLGLLARCGVPQQQPADGDRGVPAVIPDGGVGRILQLPHRAVRPPLPQRGPDGGRIGQHRVQGGQTGSLETRPSRLALDRGIFWAGIGGYVRIGGPGRRVAGSGAAGATVTGILRAERPRGGGRAGVAGRVVRRTAAAGVWRERWRSAMRVGSGVVGVHPAQARAEVGVRRRPQPHAGPQIAAQQQAAQQRHALLQEAVAARGQRILLGRSQLGGGSAQVPGLPMAGLRVLAARAGGHGQQGGNRQH